MKYFLTLFWQEYAWAVYTMILAIVCAVVYFLVWLEERRSDKRMEEFHRDLGHH